MSRIAVNVHRVRRERMPELVRGPDGACYFLDAAGVEGRRGQGAAAFGRTLEQLLIVVWPGVEEGSSGLLPDGVTGMLASATRSGSAGGASGV